MAGLLGLLLLALVVPASASADIAFCPPGSGAGQCNDASGVAISASSGRMYTADRGNHRVNAFAEDGSFLFAFGWGVGDGVSAVAQKCTTASGCHKGIAGSGTAQFNLPRRIAVDSAGNVYVGTDNFRVQKFDADGNFLLAFGWGVRNGSSEAQTCGPAATPPSATCLPGIQGEGAGQFAGAVSPIAIGPSNEIYVGDSNFLDPLRVERFSTTGSFIGQVSLPAGSVLGGMAVDSVGSIYGTSGGGGGVSKFHPDGTPYGAPYPLETALQTNTLAVDDADNLFAQQREPRDVGGVVLQVIAHYTSTGVILSRFGYGRMADRNAISLAASENSTGEVALFSQANLFGEDPDNILGYLRLPPPGPIAAPPTVEIQAGSIGSSKATLLAEVNPEGKATTYHFEFVEEAICEADEQAEGPGHCFDHATSTTSRSLGSENFRLKGVAEQIGCPDPATEAGAPDCLKSETRYRFRVVATNVDGPGEGTAEGPAFDTKPSLEIKEAWATAVGTDTATLSVKVDPLGVPATGYFEYVEKAICEAEAPGHCFDRAIQAPDVAGGESPLDFGSGSGSVQRSVALYPLPEGAAYRYRAVAENPLLSVPKRGDPLAFTTFAKVQPTEGCANDSARIDAAAYLPDCRAYEMVSPLDKNNGNIVPSPAFLGGTPAGLEQSALSGERLAYSSATAFAGSKSAGWTSQYIAQRIAGEEWSTHPISAPRGELIENFGLTQNDTEFKVFSPDLCEAWILTVTDVSLAEGEIPGSPNLYRRDDEDCGGEGAYEALTTVSPDDGSLGTPLELQGVSADGSTTIYRATDSLAGTTGSPGGLQGQMQLYVHGGGQTRFACVLPGGGETSCAGGTTATTFAVRSSSLQNAISANGKRVFWTSPAQGGGKIYVRENPLGVGTECLGGGAPCTIAISAAAETLSGTSASRFVGAATDGSKAAFVTQSVGISDLYEFDVATKNTHEIAGEVAGVAGMSEDASVIYFVSEEALAGAAVAGEVNLYRYEAGAVGEDGTYRFIAELAAADAANGNLAGGSVVTQVPVKHTARVSPDGAHLAFTSFGRPTGYDNTDTVSGKPDAEVYIYDAEADSGSGRLSCASCNPGGGRPTGRDVDNSAGESWVAATIPGWQNNLYAARALSDDGSRLYFEAVDSLSPRDSNGRQDVYQWEEPGFGDCDAGDPTFSEQNNGCISLISSGKSPRDSELRDASPSGDDVFFATLSSLLPQDYGLIDIYDARVGGGLPVPDPPPPPCEGDACQSPLTPPDVETPSSAAYEGAGNVSEGGAAKPKPRRCPKGKRRVRRKGKTSCVPKRSEARRRNSNRRGKVAR